MKLVALVRIDVLVPFEYDVPQLNLESHIGDVDGGRGVLDVAVYEEKLVEVERGRVAAARHVEEEILPSVNVAAGEIVASSIVEVREA